MLLHENRDENHLESKLNKEIWKMESKALQKERVRKSEKEWKSIKSICPICLLIGASTKIDLYKKASVSFVYNSTK